MDVIREGRAAGELLRSEAFQVALKGLKEDIYAHWLQTQPGQDVEREEFYFVLLGIDHFTARLEAMRDNAKIEQDKLDRAVPKTNIIDFSQQ